MLCLLYRETFQYVLYVYILRLHVSTFVSSISVYCTCKTALPNYGKHYRNYSRKDLNEIVKVILATLTAGLARAVGGRHPKVGGSSIKNHDERLRRGSNGDGSIVGQLKKRNKTFA